MTQQQTDQEKIDEKTRQILAESAGQKIVEKVPEPSTEKTQYQWENQTFDQTDGVHLDEGTQKGQFQDRIMAWNHEGKKIPIPARWHPTSVIKRIIAHNKLGQYTGIVMIGQSGSGKTTLTRKLIHEIICKQGESYIVKWYNGHEMLKMDEHIKDLQVGTPHIMIFDDASYTLEDAKKADVAKLANALTTIRHTLKSKVIIVMNIHYSKATLKFFRNQHFTFLTSVSVEEMGNYTDLFKDKMHVVRAFGRQYNRMMLKGYFEAQVSSFEKRRITYTTNKPFRCALVAEIADLHFMLYNKDECPKCDPANMNRSINMIARQPNTIATIMEKMRDMYGVGSSGSLPRAFATTLRFFSKVAQSKDTLSKSERQMWNHLTNIAKSGFTDWEGLNDEVNKGRKKKLDKGKQIKVKADASVLEIARMIKKEQQAEKAEKPMETPDYDSTYIPE